MKIENYKLKILSTNKNLLRKKFLAKRKAFIPFKKPLDQKIFQKFINLPQVIKAKTICFYISMSDEVDTHELIRYFFGKKRVVVPKVVGEKLELYEIKSFNDLKPGRFGILETDNSHNSYFMIHASKVDLFVVPGIVFSKSGQRIGFGKGYYDRLLKKINGYKLGLAYFWQTIDLLPRGKTDVIMDFVLTDKS